MTKTPKRPSDINQLAKFIVDSAIGEIKLPTPKQVRAKKGGGKGGVARANILTSEQKSEIARVAASARWEKTN
jgi:hypothetical protein